MDDKTKLEIAQLKMRFLEAQMMILQYQAKEVQAEIAQLNSMLQADTGVKS